MTIDKKYIDQFINVTSNAAIASYHLVGKKNKIAADQAAVDAMRTELNKIDMTGEIVIGEGTLDEAPMLYTGEILGTKQSGFPRFRIADLDAHADLLSKADKEARLIIKKGYLKGNTNKGKALKLLLKLFERNVTHEKFESG